MLPHVRYDPAHLADYFPGPDRWPSAQRHVAQPAVPTSGISNPPVLAMSARRLGERQRDEGRRRAFWREVTPPIAAWLRWFLDSRRVPGLALPVVVHPWETGWDNSPRWDRLPTLGLKPDRPYERLDIRHVAATQRPAGRDYDAYLRLAELLDAADYDLARYLEIAPFAVHDLLIDALWHGAAIDVNAMAAAAGLEPPFAERELAAYRAAFQEVHCERESDACFDRDLVTGGPIQVPTAAPVAALAGRVLEGASAERTWRDYKRLSRGARSVCTVPPSEPRFDAELYWRGPVWVSVNWLVIRGLESTGLGDEAAALRDETLELVADGGFHEYFHAVTGAGLGIDGFTWTAALTLDLLEET